MARRKTEAKKALHALLFDAVPPTSQPQTTPLPLHAADPRPTQQAQSPAAPLVPQSLPLKEASQGPTPALPTAPAKPSHSVTRGSGPGNEKEPAQNKRAPGKSEAPEPVLPAAPEKAAAQAEAAPLEKPEPAAPKPAPQQPQGVAPVTPSTQAKTAQAPKKPSLNQGLGLLRPPGETAVKKGSQPVSGQERSQAARGAVANPAPAAAARTEAPKAASAPEPQAAPSEAPVPAPARAPEPEPVLKASLLDLLLHHMRHHQFAAADVGQAGALVELVDKHPKMNTELAEWVVLHKDGPVLAHVTSEGELPRVGNKGDTALAVWLLRLLTQEPVPVPLLQAARRATPDVFASVSHLVMLQAMGRGLLERSLRDGYPQALLERLLQEWASLPDLASASIAKRQALALEVLGSTWAFGYDEAKSHAYALPTLQRLLTQRAPQ